VLSDHASTIAALDGVGAPDPEMIMMARGEQGQVWRPDTDAGAFAIKELAVRQTPADAVADIAYQETVLASGAVRLPRPIRTVSGKYLLILERIGFGRAEPAVACRRPRGDARHNRSCALNVSRSARRCRSHRECRHRSG
jgi:hypothetical protein